MLFHTCTPPPPPQPPTESNFYAIPDLISSPLPHRKQLSYYRLGLLPPPPPTHTEHNFYAILDLTSSPLSHRKQLLCYSRFGLLSATENNFYASSPPPPPRKHLLGILSPPPQKTEEEPPSTDSIPAVPGSPPLLAGVSGGDRADLRPRRLSRCGCDPPLPHPGLLHVDVDGGLAAIPALPQSHEPSL